MRHTLGMIGARPPAGMPDDHPAGPLPMPTDETAQPQNLPPDADRAPVSDALYRPMASALPRRVDDADAHLLLMLLRPVRRTSQRGGHRRGKPGGSHQPGRPPRPRDRSSTQLTATHRPGPGPGRMQRMTKPHAVQGIPDLRARTDQPCGPLPGRNSRIEAGRLLEARSQRHAYAAARRRAG